jgi:hypothetical protein
MNDDDYGRQLLRPLATEPPAATRVNVAEAMRRGRRARRIRAGAIISALTAVIAAAATGSALALTAPATKPKPDLPVDPAIPAACTAIRLPTGGAASAAVTGGDPSGTYLVGTTNPSAGKARAVLVWRDGKLAGRVPQTGRSPIMSDINASGVAVGSPAESPFLPYVYRNGRVSRLSGMGTAHAINDAGMIAGTREVGREIPVRWASPDAQPELIKLPPGTLGGRATDIAEDGTIAVQLSTMTYIEQTYLWFPDGTTRPIEAPKAANGKVTRFQSAYFRSGWLYGEVATFEPRGTASSGPSREGPPRNPNVPEGGYTFDTSPYRYHVASGTWQKLPEGVAPHLTMDWVTLEAYLGRQIFTFPEPVDKRADDDFQVTFVSDAGRTAGGTSLSKRADPNHQDEPLMWRCH